MKTLLIALLLLFPVLGHCSTLDQTQVNHTNFVPNDMIITGTSGAQTFIPSVSGKLDMISVWSTKAGTGGNADVMFEVRNINTTGAQAGMPLGYPWNATLRLANATIAKAAIPNDAELNVTFSTPATLIAGTMYAIVITSNSTSDGSNYWRFKGNTTGNLYPAGGACYHSGIWYNYTATHDTYFKTWMTVPSSVSLLLKQD